MSSTVVSPYEPLEGALRRFRAELGTEDVFFEAELRRCFRTRRERRYLKRRRQGQVPQEAAGEGRPPGTLLERLVDAWIAGAESEVGTREYIAKRWALTNRWLAAFSAPETAWRIILTILHREPPPRSFYILAADPLETLLCRYGPEFIDRVEMWARVDPEFKELLGAV